ncbi:MAG: hypothetical protein RL648_494, partial [Verrucomicrobiota bacterium]
MKILFFHGRLRKWGSNCGLLKGLWWAMGLKLLVGVSSGAGEAARPWVFWYWMEAAVTAEGIEADLRAMAEAGIGGAYLMPIKGAVEPPHVSPPVEQLSPLFWERVRFAVEVADREGVELAMHACDGFAVAGGPWVEPWQSMQQLVWSRMDVDGGGRVRTTLPQPLTREGFYRDVAVYAIPGLVGAGLNSHSLGATAISSKQERLDRLLNPQNKERFRMDEPGWIEIQFPSEIVCRSVRVVPDGNNFQAMRMTLLASVDGVEFEEVMSLEPPRHGWQDEGAVTWLVPETRGRVFRFVFDPEGSGPGAEDLDFAKWRPVLKVMHLEISEEVRVANFEGKSGAVWRIASEVDAQDLPPERCVPLKRVLCLEGALSPEGELEIELPAGRWTLLRMGHTSTGKTNYIGGAGKGLEIDKFSEEAARLQFREWFGRAIKEVGQAGRGLSLFHVDSWECGSQNWSAQFREDFEDLRGYDLLPYLPIAAGIPLESAQTSEQFLHDWRTTISELLNSRFFGTLQELASEAGCHFSAESVAPTMTADALRHFGTVDLPMGEFWLRSPTHDKPTDIRDAISGGRIYGKNIIQAEAFTQLRMEWDEHPGMLKALADRHFAAGINRLVFQVFAHNPWLDRAPGMTLSGVGLYFQRDQTWWPAVKGWIDYVMLCQEWLQRGQPVVDVAVFTGEDIPRRSLLPEDLVTALPGLMDVGRIEAEQERLKNVGVPQREWSAGVRASANIRDPLDWIDPLNGYQYDSINPDALVRLGRARDGRLVLPGGSEYGVLVVPGNRRGAPNAGHLSGETVAALIGLMEAGVPVMFETLPTIRIPVQAGAAERRELEQQLEKLIGLVMAGRGIGPWGEPTFTSIGLEPDLKISGERGPGVAWTHRHDNGVDIYFISNQAEVDQELDLSFRVRGLPFVINPMEGPAKAPIPFDGEGRTELKLTLEPHGSRLVIIVPED